MSSSSCDICDRLSEAGVTTDKKEVCPPETSALEAFSPGGGLNYNNQICRCRKCGTLYQYRHHYEYDVAGSWDDHCLWRLSQDAQQCIGSILAAPAQGRDELLVHALHHPDVSVKEASALLLWIIIDRLDLIGKDVVLAACQTLNDPDARNFSYNLLLSYLRRGPEEARIVLRSLAHVKLDELGESYRRALINEAQKYR